MVCDYVHPQIRGALNAQQEVYVYEERNPDDEAGEYYATCVPHPGTSALAGQIIREVERRKKEA
jgi:hypothetical protein